MKDGCHFDGVLSIELKSKHTAMTFTGALQTICCLVGQLALVAGMETLIKHQASIKPADHAISTPGVLHLTVGLKDSWDLICVIDAAPAFAEQVNQESV